MDGARSMRAVKGSLGRSLAEGEEGWKTVAWADGMSRGIDYQPVGRLCLFSSIETRHHGAQAQYDSQKNQEYSR
jgi:hypothetical protein